MSDAISLIAQAGGVIYSAFSPFSVLHARPSVEILPCPELLETRTILDEPVTITARASIEMEAVILCSSWARQLPSCPGEAIVAPLDLGLGWGRMSDPITRNLSRIKQVYTDDGGRWMSFSSESQLQVNMSMKHSAHIHVVFPPKFIMPEKLPKKGTPVYLKGLLVDLDWPDRKWMTDLVPGNEHCETVYLQRMIVNI